MRLTGLILPLALATLTLPATAFAQTGGTYRVTEQQIVDRKAVFATVESIDVVSARARIGGTIGELRVDEGHAVGSRHRSAPPMARSRHWNRNWPRRESI